MQLKVMCDVKVRPRPSTLDRFHERIQTAMGWTNSHLHKFEIHGERFGNLGRDQCEQKKNAMRAGAQETHGEIEREIEAIRARFANPIARIYSMAVTFLVPEKLAVGA